MHNIFTVILAFDLLTRPEKRRIFDGAVLDGLDAPNLVAACTDDIKAGKIQIRYLTPFGVPETYVIPHQKGGYDSVTYFTSPFVFSTELRDVIAQADQVYLYAEHDDEMVERNYHRMFSINVPLKDACLEGFSDGLKIEKVESFNQLVRDTFSEIYLSKSGYDPAIKMRKNPLKGLTDVIFKNKCKGEVAEEFEKLFPAPECRSLIIDEIRGWHQR